MLHPAPACPLNMSQVQCQALGEDLPPPVASQEADRCPRFWWSALPSRAGPVKDGELNPPVLKCSEVFEIHTLLFNMCIYIYILNEVMQMKHPSIEHLREILGTSTPRGTKCDPLVLQWRFSAEGGRQEVARTAEVLLELPLAPPHLPQGS